jgi:hypothetical protein
VTPVLQNNVANEIDLPNSIGLLYNPVQRTVALFDALVQTSGV